MVSLNDTFSITSETMGCTGRSSSKARLPSWIRYWKVSITQVNVACWTRKNTR